MDDELEEFLARPAGAREGDECPTQVVYAPMAHAKIDEVFAPGLIGHGSAERLTARAADDQGLLAAR